MKYTFVVSTDTLFETIKGWHMSLNLRDILNGESFVMKDEGFERVRQQAAHWSQEFLIVEAEGGFSSSQLVVTQQKTYLCDRIMGGRGYRVEMNLGRTVPHHSMFLDMVKRGVAMMG